MLIYGKVEDGGKLGIRNYYNISSRANSPTPRCDQEYRLLASPVDVVREYRAENQ